MASKKKAKKSKSKTKKKKVKKTAKRPAARKPAKKKKTVAKKAKAAKRKPKSKPKPKAKPKTSMKVVPAKSAPAPKPAAPVAPVGGERIGVVTHYYSHLMVAIIALEAGTLRVGETIHIKGHTSDFKQVVDSMELNHVHVDEARALQSVGLRVKEHAREHDVVYKVKM